MPTSSKRVSSFMLFRGPGMGFFSKWHVSNYRNQQHCWWFHYFLLLSMYWDTNQIITTSRDTKKSNLVLQKSVDNDPKVAILHFIHQSDGAEIGHFLLLWDLLQLTQFLRAAIDCSTVTAVYFSLPQHGPRRCQLWMWNSQIQHGGTRNPFGIRRKLGEICTKISVTKRVLMD